MSTCASLKAILSQWEVMHSARGDECLQLFRQRVEAVMTTLQTFHCVWKERPDYYYLGYRDGFQIRIAYWQMRDIWEDELKIAFARQGIPFQRDSYLGDGQNKCLAWFPSMWVYSYLGGYPPEKPYGNFEWVSTQLKERVPYWEQLPSVERILLRQNFLLEHFGVGQVYHAFNQGWAALIEYIRQVQEIASSGSPTFLSFPPPCF